MVSRARSRSTERAQFIPESREAAVEFLQDFVELRGIEQRGVGLKFFCKLHQRLVLHRTRVAEQSMSDQVDLFTITGGYDQVSQLPIGIEGVHEALDLACEAFGGLVPKVTQKLEVHAR